MKVLVLKDNSKVLEGVILNEDIINGSEIYIGREDDCHIKLDSQQISRYHAKIQKVENELILEVLSEFEGIRVNGLGGTRFSIKENDSIRVLNFEIRLEEFNEIFKPVKVEEEEIIINSIDDSINLNSIEGAQGLDDYLLMNNVTEEPELTEVVDNPTEMFSENAEPIEEVISTEPEDDFLDSADEDQGLDNNQYENDDLDELEGLNNDQSNDFLDDTPLEFPSSEEVSEGFVSEFTAIEDNFDDGFSNDDPLDSNLDDDNSSTQVLSNFANYYLQIFGEFAPFDKFKIEDSETFIGRDPEKCKIILEDSEVSKVHAVIKKSLINCVLEDLDSSNGIIFNGERVNKAELTNGDEFVIGDTSFTVIISSDIIEVEKDRLMPVEDNQQVEIEEIVEEEVDYDQFGEDGEGLGVETEKSLIKRIWKDKRKRLYLIVGVFLLLLLLILDDDSSNPQPLNTPVKKEEKKEASNENKMTHSPEVLERLEQNYILAQSKSELGEYYEAKEYIDIVASIDPNYKETQIYLKLIQEGYDKLIKMKEEEQEKKERIERQTKISELLKKASEAVKERNVPSAKNYFNLILELDPENPEVTPLRIDLEAWEAEQLRVKQEKELAAARRQAMVDKLTPGKTLYLREEWYKAIDKLEKFIKSPDIDEDLLAEATEMLKESKSKLVAMINPLLSKARSYQEGQDLKQAFETYGEVLKIDPSSEEALNERNDIFNLLLVRSKKVYREALIAESLSLYPKAKEKFQEVQQISPINSEYYIKATEKLKNYLE